MIFTKNRLDSCSNSKSKKVKDAKELDDNCQTKNYKKDCITIERLIKDAIYFVPYLPEGIWAKLRNLSNTRAELIRKQNYEQ